MPNNKTRYLHKLWGEGVLLYKDSEGLTIDFIKHGIKKMSESSIKHGILKEILEDTPQSKAPAENNASLRQFDKADIILGKRNILESFESKDVVIFNESYTVVGELLSAKKISALYDLTVLGDINANEILVNGDLTVIGNITSEKLTCANYLICQGEVESKSIDVGNIIADSIRCESFNCEGNAVIKNTIDIDDNCKVDNVIFAGEGIVGAGSFSALNAIANEYFEFDGKVEGNVLELLSDKKINEATKTEILDISSMPLPDIVEQLDKRLTETYKECEDLDETEIINLLKVVDSISPISIESRFKIFNTLTKISYQDEINEFGDYLITVYAKNFLPEEIYTYETIDHIDGIMLPEANKVLHELEFKPYSVERIALCIQIIKQCSNNIGISVEEALDKIFTSIGLKYSTIKNIISRYQSNVETVKQANLSTKAKVEFLDSSVASVAKKFGITDFELMKLSTRKVKTCKEFLSLTEHDFKDMFSKNIYFGNHLWKKQQAMKEEADKLL